MLCSIYWQAVSFGSIFLPAGGWVSSSVGGRLCICTRSSHSQTPTQPCPRYILPVDMDISATMYLDRCCVHLASLLVFWCCCCCYLVVISRLLWAPAYGPAITDLLWRIAVPRKRRKSISGRRDLCDFLIKLRIDFYRPATTSNMIPPSASFHRNMIRCHHQQRRRTFIFMCFALVSSPYAGSVIQLQVWSGWLSIYLTAHSQSAENWMTTTMAATYKSIRRVWCLQNQAAGGNWECMVVATHAQWLRTNLSVQHINWKATTLPLSAQYSIPLNLMDKSTRWEAFPGNSVVLW